MAARKHTQAFSAWAVIAIKAACFTAAMLFVIALLYIIISPAVFWLATLR